MSVRTIFWGGASGLLFGTGLALSGMIDPARVLGFLDIAALFGPGTWDPTLAFVMVGALIVTMPAFAFLRRRGAPWAAPRFEWPTRRDIDGRLVTGAALFGIGWGLVGLCPGPAVAALSTALPAVLLFCAAMAVGMWLAKRFG